MKPRVGMAQLRNMRSLPSGVWGSWFLKYSLLVDSSIGGVFSCWRVLKMYEGVDGPPKPCSRPKPREEEVPGFGARGLRVCWSKLRGSGRLVWGLGGKIGAGFMNSAFKPLSPGKAAGTVESRKHEVSVQREWPLQTQRPFSP